MIACFYFRMIAKTKESTNATLFRKLNTANVKKGK
jgi:hypothetical protein